MLNVIIRSAIMLRMFYKVSLHLTLSVILLRGTTVIVIKLDILMPSVMMMSIMPNVIFMQSVIIQSVVMPTVAEPKYQLQFQFNLDLFCLLEKTCVQNKSNL
jgi:hypothetical protein